MEIQRKGKMRRRRRKEDLRALRVKRRRLRKMREVMRSRKRGVTPVGLHLLTPLVQGQCVKRLHRMRMR